MKSYVFGLFLILSILSFFFLADKSVSGTRAPLCFYKSFDAGDYPFSIYGADIDNDGLTDLVVGN